jgi:Rab-GTPase-TBC domain
VPCRFVHQGLGSWILIAFKREFPFEDVLRLWEVLWTDYYTNGMVLFVALAVLESHRDVILRYLVEFDEILKVRALPISSPHPSLNSGAMRCTPGSTAMS